MLKELTQALSQPTSHVYVLTHQKVVQIAYLMVLGVLKAEGTDGVIDVLERGASNLMEQKSVTPNGYCDNSVQMGEQYCFLTGAGLDGNTKRLEYKAFLNYVDNMVCEDGVESTVEQLREKIEDGKLVRIYHITDRRGDWREDHKIGEFVKYLDILRTLMQLNDVGLDDDEKRVLMPFIPVYGLKSYDEFDFCAFTDACSARASRRSYAKDYYTLKGVTVDVWDDSIWDDRGRLLVKNAKGQLRPADTNDGEMRAGTESDVKEWPDPLLAHPTKEYPNLEQETYYGLIQKIAQENLPDQIKMFRCLFEQMCLTFRIVLKNTLEAHPKDWEKFILLQEIAKRLPETMVNYLLYAMELTDEQSLNLYHPDNIPHKYRRMLAHRFGVEKIRDFRTHLLKTELPDALRHFITQKEAAGEKLSKDQAHLLLEFIKSIKSDFESIDLEEYCRQRAEELKKEPDSKESAESEPTAKEDPEPRPDEDASEEEKNDNSRGGKAGQNIAEGNVPVPDMMFQAAVVAAKSIYAEKGKEDQEKRNQQKKKGGKKGQGQGKGSHSKNGG